jgi:hypothetical protein
MNPTHCALLNEIANQIYKACKRGLQQYNVLNIFETRAGIMKKGRIHIRDSIIKFCRNTVYLLEDCGITAERRCASPSDPHSYAGENVSSW